MSTVTHNPSVSKGKKRRLRLAALGLILLGLWGMLALLLGDSVGKETHYRADLKADLEPGFGETRATPHPLDKGAAGSTFLPPLCLAVDCLGTEEVVSTAWLDRPVDDGTDDATSSIGRSPNPEGNPPPSNIAEGGNPFLPGLFIPGGNPLPGGTPGHPNPTDNFDPPDNTPQNPPDTPPPDFTQPPFSVVPEGPPNGGSEGPEAPEEPKGPQGPGGPGGTTPDQPIQIPEPLTLSLFATGVVASMLLRRRKPRASR